MVCLKHSLDTRCTCNGGVVLAQTVVQEQAKFKVLYADTDKNTDTLHTGILSLAVFGITPEKVRKL
jgi:hypothetical protein